MRSPLDVLMGRIGGLPISGIARRTVPCQKYVIESGKDSLSLCLLVDSKYLYRFPFEDHKGVRSLEVKARYLHGEMEHLRLREFMPGYCRFAGAIAANLSAQSGPSLNQTLDTPTTNPTEARRQSSALLALYGVNTAWVRRRTDVAEMLDEVALRWTRTIEITMPNVDAVAGTRLRLGRVPVPLALHSKSVLTGFAMADGTGRRLSMLTRHEDQQLVQGMMQFMAEDVLGGAIPEVAKVHLDAVVASPPEKAKQHLGQLNQMLPRLLPHDDRDGHVLNKKRAVLRKLINDLVDQFVLMTMLPNRPGERVLIEYTFIDLGRPRSGREGSLKLDVGRAPNFHFELVTPDELDITSRAATREAAIAPATAAVGGPPPSISCVGRYLSLWVHDQQRGASYEVPFALRLHRPGWARTATWVSSLTAAAMFTAAVSRFVLHVHPASDVAAPVLVATPAALVALLLREVRHRLTRRLASGAQWSVALTSLALAAGAAALALHFPDTPAPLAEHGTGYRALAWCAASVLSLIVAIWTWFRARRW